MMALTLSFTFLLPFIILIATNVLLHYYIVLLHSCSLISDHDTLHNIHHTLMLPASLASRFRDRDKR